MNELWTHIIENFWKYAIPIILTACVTAYTIYLTIQFRETSIKNQKAAQSLSEDINNAITENKKITEKIKITTKESNEINKKLKKISKQIATVTSNTESIASDIELEQKKKGSISLKMPIREKYELVKGPGKDGKWTYLRKGLETEFGFDALTMTFSDDPTIAEKLVLLNLKLDGEKFLVSTTIRGTKGNVIAEIKDNQWTVGNNIFSRNWDDDGLEVIDEKGRVVLQIDLKNEKVYIKGIFCTPTRIWVLTEETDTWLEYKDPQLEHRLSKYSNEISRIFKHGGDNYLNMRETKKKKINKLKIKIIETRKYENQKLINETLELVKYFKPLIKKNKNEKDELSRNFRFGNMVEHHKRKMDEHHKKNQEISDKLVSLWDEDIVNKSSAFFMVLNERLPDIEHLNRNTISDFNIPVGSYSRQISQYEIESNIDELEFMAKTLLKIEKPLSKQQIIKDGEKLLENIKPLYELDENLHFKKEKKGFLEFDEKYKVEVLVLRNDILMLIPDYKDKETYFYLNTSAGPHPIYDIYNNLMDLLEKLKNTK